MGIALMTDLIKSGELEQYVNNPFMNIVNKVSKQELISVVDVWLDKAFTLTEDNLGRMTKLANFQRRKVQQTVVVEPNLEEAIKIDEVNTLINKAF
jgi:hypothetical protein